MPFGSQDDIVRCHVAKCAAPHEANNAVVRFVVDNLRRSSVLLAEEFQQFQFFLMLFDPEVACNGRNHKNDNDAGN